MMRALLGMLVATSLACASANLTVTQPLPEPVRRVSLDMESPDGGTLTAERESRFRSALTTSLLDSGITVLPAGETDTALHGKIERYKTGNRVLRYFVRFGAGSGKFASSWSVLDASGETIGACRVDGSVSFGVFGGSYDDVLEKVGDRLSEFLLKRK